MDKTLALKTKDFKKALDTLKEVMKMDYINNGFLRDATIQRFEYTYELCWKTAKKKLEVSFGIIANSPKEVFRKLKTQKILTAKETETALTMADDRNNTTHTYNEKLAIELVKKLKNYLKIFNKILRLL